MLYTLRFFSLQNTVCFIMLTCLVPVLFTFYIQGVLKLKKNSGAKGLNAELNPISHLVALLGAHHIFHVSGLRVKFCPILGGKTAQKYMIKMALGEESINRTHVFERCNRCKEGRTSVESDESRGIPSKSRNSEKFESVCFVEKRHRTLTLRIGTAVCSCHAVVIPRSGHGTDEWRRS